MENEINFLSRSKIIAEKKNNIEYNKNLNKTKEKTSSINLNIEENNSIIKDNIKLNQILEISIGYFPNPSTEVEVLRINPLGLMTNSLRKKKDKYTYFGYLPDINSPDIQEENTIDYLLPMKQSNKSTDVSEKVQNNEGRYFQISYNEITNNYYIKDLGKGLGTFVKINGSLRLKDSTLLNLGESFMVINFIYDDTNKENENLGETFKSDLNSKISSYPERINGIDGKLRVRIYEGKNNTSYREKVFFPIDNKVIKIGRVKHDNDIELDDNLVSKINAHIIYKNNEGWFIIDGNEKEDKDGNIIKINSTNGTWFLPIEDYLIYEGMIFKGNYILFSCHLVYNSTDFDNNKAINNS